MKIVEFRIIMPLELPMCRMASKYSVNRRTKEESNGGDGFEILEANHYTEEDGTPGRYVHRMVHFKQKVPSSIRWAVPEKYAHAHEYNRNSFPHYKCDFHIDSFGDKMILETETKHIPYTLGMEIPENIMEFTERELGKRKIVYLDLLDGPKGKPQFDMHGYSCPEINMEELHSTKKADDSVLPGWVENYHGPMTLIIKTVKFRFKWPGIQTLTENIVTKNVFYNVYLDTHRAMLHYAPQWYQMTEEDIIAMEQKTKEDLSKIDLDRD